MSHRRHAKHSSHKAGTRDKSRNSTHNSYMSESHATDPGSAHSHIRVIPAPDRRGSAMEESVPVNRTALTQAQTLMRRLPTLADPQKATFASKLKGVTQDENRPISAPKAGVQTKTAGPAKGAGGSGAGINSPTSLGYSTQGSGVSLLPSSGRNSETAARPSKVVFAPRSSSSLRHVSGETVDTSMQYGSQAQSSGDSQRGAEDRKVSDQQGGRVSDGAWMSTGGQNNVSKRSQEALTIAQNPDGITATTASTNGNSGQSVETHARLTPVQNPRETEMPPPGILQPSQERVNDINALNEDCYEDKSYRLQLPRSIDMSKYKGNISPLAVHCTPSQLGSPTLVPKPGHGKAVQKAPFGHRYADKFGHDHEARRRRYFEMMEKQLRDDRERLNRTIHRKSLMHRLETLELCNYNETDFSVNFTRDDYLRNFLWNQENQINHIDGTGPWGFHCLGDVQDSNISPKFDLLVLEEANDVKPHIEDSYEDPAYAQWVQDWYDTGKANVYILTEEEIAKLQEQTRLYLDEKQPFPEDAIQNPTLLPYNAYPYREGLEVKNVWSKVEGMDPYSPPSDPSYWQQVPENDPGFHALNAQMVCRDNSDRPEREGPAKRDFQGEILWIAEARNRNQKMFARKRAMMSIAERESAPRWPNGAVYQEVAPKALLLQRRAAEAQTPTPIRTTTQYPPGLTVPASLGQNGKHQLATSRLDSNSSEHSGSPGFSGAPRKLFPNAKI
ncbi:hypothetical protein BZA05DRAFT_449192 [Tricharina praecox]|uniref:uncharacterized protein n=1 Tax=Tricharina praecox TaxID=43433 RepID=UPI00221FC92F|nr:uncharacterized protein BZA05DRAFT_449192 [Tricharina praecox]KAI5842316.1 hypothetical protein BZA05DRAFT_449192 [Tricharina praecox]